MLTKKAVESFIGANGNKRFNCAESIARTFKEKFILSDEFIASFSAFGSGKAPKGLCGAFYAVEEIIRKIDKDKVATVGKLFNDSIGSLYCLEIKKTKKASCLECVKKAASILEEI